MNGHTYVRAYCTSRQDWRTFRVDRINAVLATSPATDERPKDLVANWLTRVGDEGDEIVVIVEAGEPLALRALAGCAVAGPRATGATR